MTFSIRQYFIGLHESNERCNSYVGPSTGSYVLPFTVHLESYIKLVGLYPYLAPLTLSAPIILIPSRDSPIGPGSSPRYFEKLLYHLGGGGGGIS